MIKNLFNFCCHPTSSFRTTYTKYATSSSSLLSKKGARRDRLRQFEKKPQSNARNARPIPIKKRPNIRYKAKKKINPRDGVFSQTIKQKTNPFFPL